jgi:ribosome-binding factor A
VPREFSRGRRIADHIQKELAVLIQQEIQDPRVGLVTINEVKVSRDLAFADVYFTSFASDVFSRKKGADSGLLN